MRRQRIERGIYRSERTYGWVYEIGYYDNAGKQRWETVGTNIEEARRLREERAINGVGGASKYKQMRTDLFEIQRIADKHNVPTKKMIIEAMRSTSNPYPRQAWLTLAGLALAQARRYEPRP